MNPDFTFIWPLSCLKDGDHLSVPKATVTPSSQRWRMFANRCSCQAERGRPLKSAQAGLS